MIEKLAIGATIGIGLVIGMLWPIPRHSGPSAPAAGGAEVVIERNSDHHYYADADVNGRPVHFMIDTGAGETALTESDAKAIGLTVDPNKYEVVGDGASGMVRGQYVDLKSIDLNGIRQEGARAVIVPGANVSLLGQPFLEKIDEIVIRNAEMRLKADAQH
jgi:aspartyl protease family protein